MRVEFEGVNWVNQGWILEDDKIIQKRLFRKDMEYLISNIDKVFHNPNPISIGFPGIAFNYDGKYVCLNYLKDAITMAKGMEAFKYIEAQIKKKQDELKKLEKIEQEKELAYKISRYKKIKTKVIDENLEILKNKYEIYIEQFLISLPKNGEYIKSGATIDEIANSCDELKEFYNENKDDFLLMIQYLCNNKLLLKKENLLGQIKYNLSISIEKETIMDNQLLEIHILDALSRKDKEYIQGCGNDVTLKRLFEEYNNSLNKYRSSVLNMPLQTRKPMSSTSATVIGTVLGGTSIGIMAGIEAKDKMNSYIENQRNYISSKISSASVREQVEYYFYKIQTILYEFEDVYNDWIKEKNRIINEKS